LSKAQHLHLVVTRQLGQLRTANHGSAMPGTGVVGERRQQQQLHARCTAPGVGESDAADKRMGLAPIGGNT
jgi:hypothetical protein